MPHLETVLQDSWSSKWLLECWGSVLSALCSGGVTYYFLCWVWGWEMPRAPPPRPLPPHHISNAASVGPSWSRQTVTTCRVNIAKYLLTIYPPTTLSNHYLLYLLTIYSTYPLSTLSTHYLLYTLTIYTNSGEYSRDPPVTRHVLTLQTLLSMENRLNIFY